jgi:hypothetical protein
VIDSEALLIASKIKKLDAEAYRPEWTPKNPSITQRDSSAPASREKDAEKRFHSWDLQEKAIRKAQAVISPK